MQNRMPFLTRTMPPLPGPFDLCPILDKKSGQVFHLGANIGYFDYDYEDDEPDQAQTFEARPNAHLAEKLVGVDFENPEKDWRYALEAAYSGHGFLITVNIRCPVG